MEKRNPKCFGDGQGLVPVQPLDLNKVDSFDELLRQMSHTAFGGRSLGEAADVLERMVKDPECFTVLTLSGAMTIAKMGLVAAEMVDRGWIQAVVSTGALMCHGFVETSGRTHFKYDPSMDDEELFRQGYNRVYDTLELEENLDQIEEIIREILTAGDVERSERAGRLAVSSHSFCKALGSWLLKNTEDDSRALLKSCFQKNVPVYIPAFTDSELALDFALHSRSTEAIAFDPFLDLEDYTKRIDAAKKIAVFTIGGGVPRNWAQQVGPYLDLISRRTGAAEHAQKRFLYAVRICPEPEHWGGLSGCSYSEGVSWGKFVPQSDGGRFAEVHCDATIAWPLVVKAVMQRLS